MKDVGEDLGDRKTLGGRPLSNGERGLPPKPTLYQSRFHHAPSNIRADFKLSLGRIAVEFSFYGWVFYYFIASYRFGRKLLFLVRNFKLYTSMALFHGKCYFLVREFRVVVPKFSRQYLSVCKRDFPMQGDVTLKQGTVADTNF